MTMRVAIYGPNLPNSMQRKGGFHVHASNCADCAKLDKHPSVDERWDIDVSSVAEIGEEIYADHIAEGSMTLDDAVSDLYLYPCVNLPKESA